MRLLLDTHILLWWLKDARELGKRGRQLIGASSNVVFVSAATIWEIRIKEALGKLNLPADFEEVLATQEFERLPVTHAHAHALRGLPLHHRDPFDRMLIAQARSEALTLLTHDQSVQRYDVDAIVL